MFGAEGGSVEGLGKWLFEGRDLPTWTQFAGLDPLGKAIIISAIRQRTKRPITVVFESPSEARTAMDNFSYLLGGRVEVHYIPPVEFDFHKGVFPDPQLIYQRNVSLFHVLNDAKKRIFLTTPSALLQKTLPVEQFMGATISLVANQEVDRDQFISQLLEAGYQRQPIAYDPGTFSVRGGVMDVFSPLYSYPLRIEFFGDLIEEMRLFEPQNQRSREKLEKAEILPVRLSILPRGERFNVAAIKIKDRLDHQGVSKVDREDLINRLQAESSLGQLAYLFPLLSGGSAPLGDYFPKDTLWLWDDQEKLNEVIEEREMPRFQQTHRLFEEEPAPIAEFSQLFLSGEELKDFRKNNTAFEFKDFISKDSEAQSSLNSQKVSFSQERASVKHTAKATPALEAFAKRFKDWMDEGYRIQLVCHTQTHAERAQFLFYSYDLKAKIHSGDEAAFPKLLQTESSELNLWQGYIGESEIFPDLKIIILSEEEIFGRKKRLAQSKSWASKSSVTKAIGNFRELRPKDYVVHKEHGIAKYLGLKSMNFLGEPNDYVLLEYREGDKLYVPVYRLNVVQKYVGGESAKPVLDKLGGERWARAKKKAEKAVAEIAAELIEIQARRKMVSAPAFSDPGSDFQQFEMEFPFDETPDQRKAIEDLMADLSETHPMDRLVVGDVGYGKTEVAIRAAYRANLDNLQVAVLVPTTVLAFQHYETFTARFKNTAVRVEMVSRLRSAAQNKKALERVAAGKIDIIIGTHRLLSRDVVFKNLGLVVVDEEHRFGVIHKERLKKICQSVHVLTMTATPIPRTLNMSMMGIKDISIISTPPPDRLSVRTFVCRSSDEVLSEAISNELSREGQIFYLHNRVQSIHHAAEKIRELFPKVHAEVVHGQMHAATLEKKMLDFYQGNFEILVTTSIIESGLDIPRANTIIIDDAHKLGLAQIYQLRGRVGRSNRRAYCYLLVPPEGTMTEEAKQRLQTIQRYTELGAGFNIASHDLEIRGSGDLLGKEQSGQINAVGIDLYFDLLEESIRYLRGHEKKIDIEPEINLKIRAFFPDDYLPDISERIAIYRRLSSVEDEEGVSQIEEEIRDRFGNPPEEVENLLGLMRIKLYLKPLHVTHMNCGPKKTSLQFASSTPVKPERIVELIEDDPNRYSVTPDHKLVFTAEAKDWRELLVEIQRLSELLVPN